jgi:hypothetical protein
LKERKAGKKMDVPFSPLSPFRPRGILPELEDINEFARKYHHSENPAADTEPIKDRELQGYVKRTLALVGKF